MRPKSPFGWLALLTAVLITCGTAAAQDFRSGLSAYNTGDFARAFHDWLGLAEQGDPAAEPGVGFLLHKGLGVAPLTLAERIEAIGRRRTPAQVSSLSSSAAIRRP